MIEFFARKCAEEKVKRRIVREIRFVHFAALQHESDPFFPFKALMANFEVVHSGEISLAVFNLLFVFTNLFKWLRRLY